MAQILTINKNDELFPESFRAIGKDCPERIYVMGNLDLLKSEHMVAIIGSRKATRAGNSKAYELGLNYAKKGYVVVSGLALGCDAAAHRGCMAGNGGTIAIVASGLDIVHPYENIPLQEEILRKGVLYYQNSHWEPRLILHGSLPETVCRQHSLRKLWWQNVLFTAELCIPCALPKSTERQLKLQTFHTARKRTQATSTSSLLA
jgi:hypothetical protein